MVPKFAVEKAKLVLELSKKHRLHCASKHKDRHEQQWAFQNGA
jgi:hypothetical protein